MPPAASSEPWVWPVALACALLAGALAWVMPAWLRRLPEPEEAVPAVSSALGAPPPKQPYAEIAVLPWLRPALVGVSAVVAAVLALRLGPTGALVYLVPLVPLCALLFVVDLRTTLLPTRLIQPAYAALAVLLVLAAVLDRDPGALGRAALAWLVVGGWFWVCWWLLGAWGFGDVRLSRLLGPALGYLGWPEALLGLVAMLLLGALGGVLLTLRHRSLRRRYPYGPFMILGAGLAALWATDLARSLGYPVGS